MQVLHSGEVIQVCVCVCVCVCVGGCVVFFLFLFMKFGGNFGPIRKLVSGSLAFKNRGNFSLRAPYKQNAGGPMPAHRYTLTNCLFFSFVFELF